MSCDIFEPIRLLEIWSSLIYAEKIIIGSRPGHTGGPLPTWAEPFSKSRPILAKVTKSEKYGVALGHGGNLVSW